MKNRKKVLLLLGVCIFVTMFIGVTYALWQVVLQQSGSNVLTSGCFKMTLEEVEGSEINLEKAYPILDEEGMKLTPYKFKIVNTCDSKAAYSIALETLNTSDLSEEYLKVLLNDGTPSILNSKKEATPILENASKSYILESGYLDGNEEKEYELRLWLDEDAPASDAVMNRTWSGKVTINANMVTEIPKGPGMLRNVNDDLQAGMWEYSWDISKIVIQNELNPIEGAIKVSDESALQDGSVMSYVVLNEDEETYTAYLQSTDKLILNPDSSRLFLNFLKVVDIEGMEYLDTSNVTNMGSMFYGMKNLLSLDVSHFDTSKVTDMSSMFREINFLKELNFGENFNTSKVTDMSSMFFEIRSLESLDVSGFDTSNVTNMSSMFRHMYGLTSLDVSGFDTSKVTDMSDMFSGMSSLSSLELGNLFNTSNVTDMNDMFSNCSSLESLDVSGFDTSNVTNMSSMFLWAKNLINITYGDNFIRKSGSNIASMFSNCPANRPTHESWNGAFE